MEEIIRLFIDDLIKSNCAPLNEADIVADDTVHGYKIDGDTNGEKTGTYQLKIEGDFGCGWFRNHRHGETYSFTKKSAKPMTAKERAEYKEKVSAQKKASAAARLKEQNAVAKTSSETWNKAKAPPPDHPYLKRKGVKPHNLKIHNGNLIVPMYANNKFWGYQKILPNGSKFFLEGLRKEGCFCPLSSKSDNKDIIVIAEGFATGASIREATGYPVLVAFDAGNLMPVAKATRKKHPNARIIIAADNDQWTKNAKKELENVGLIKAKAAATKIEGHVVWPEFPNDDPSKRSDFNDLHLSEGYEAIKNKLQAAAIVATPKPETTPGDLASLTPHPMTVPIIDAGGSSLTPDPHLNWGDGLIYKDSKLDKDKIDNMILMLQHQPDLRGVFRFNEFAREMYVVRPPPWLNRRDKENWFVRRVEDDDYTLAAGFLQNLGLDAIAIDKVRRCIKVASKFARFNPAKDYFTGLQWDAKPRLATWLRDFCGATKDDPEYVSAIGKKWLTAGVARVMNPGEKFDHMLIFEGSQDGGKSMLLAELATFGEYREKYFIDTLQVTDIGSPAATAMLQGKLIVEIQELSSFHKKDADNLKRVITTCEDRVQRKYENQETVYPRQFILAGTYNPIDGTYLTDPTGNRRFWPVLVANKINLKGLRQVKDQLWAEAYHLWTKGEKLWLEDAMYSKAQDVQASRMVVDSWTDVVLNVASQVDKVRIQNIYEALDMPRDRWHRGNDGRINRILKQNGYENKVIYNTTSKRSERVWVKKDDEPQEEMSID